MTNEEKLKSLDTEQLSEEIIFKILDRVRMFFGRAGVGKEEMIKYLNSSTNITPDAKNFTITIPLSKAKEISAKKGCGLIEIFDDINIGDRLSFVCDDEEGDFIRYDSYYVEEIHNFGNTRVASFVPWGKGTNRRVVKTNE